MSTITEALAERVTNLVSEADAAATRAVQAGEAVQSTASNPNKSSIKSGSNVKQYPNVLEKFASYTPLWTMAALTPEQFNNPASYRNSPADLKHIIFASGGRYGSQRTSTLYGTPEYFINNFVMATVITATEKTGNSNAITFKFDVFEPYSMGLFLQSLQIAALEAKHPSYLQAPYVLKLDFLGSTDSGEIFTGVKSKYFTIKLNKVTFETSESGSTYKVEASPFNHSGYASTVNRVFNDIAITGDKNKELTVKHLLVEGENSLCSVLNRAEREISFGFNKRQNFPDIYEVQFPSNITQLFNITPPPAASGATTDPNAPAPTEVGKTGPSTLEYGENIIGRSTMGTTASSGGNIPFKREGDVIDSKTGKVQRNQMIIDPLNRKFQFTQNQSLTSIINQIVVSSAYATNAIQKVPDDKGFISWFKLDVQIQLMDFDDKRGDYAKRIIYRVIPYNVHVSIFSNPTSAPPGYAQLEKLIAKRYDYIYSAANNDVLRFDIKIDNLFFAGANPKSEESNGANSNLDQKGIAEDRPKTTQTNQGASEGAAIAAQTGGIVVKKDPALLNQAGNAGSGETTEQLVAKTFHNAFLSSNSNLVKVDLEILGDPYWMVDSGIGNYFAPPSADNILTTEDGTMNYEGSDVYVYLTFRTPRDINENTGLYEFPSDGRESPFSGIYKVTFCENNFVDGSFKQKLRCIRMPLQPLDFNGQPQPVNAATAINTAIGPSKDTTATGAPLNPRDRR
jgi:hypothetical protein